MNSCYVGKILRSRTRTSSITSAFKLNGLSPKKKTKSLLVKFRFFPFKGSALSSSELDDTIAVFTKAYAGARWYLLLSHHLLF